MKTFMIKIPFLALLLVFDVKGFSQNGAAIAAAASGGRSKYNVAYQKHTGYLILTNAQKVNGTFEYADMEFPTYNLKEIGQNGKVIKRFKLKEVDKVVLAGADRLLTTRDSTYFFSLNRSARLFRQLTFGGIEVYDQLFSVNETPGLVGQDLLIRYKGKQYYTHSDKEFISLITQLSPSLETNHASTAAELIAALNKQ